MAMSSRLLSCAVGLSLFAVSAGAGEIRGRVLVDGKATAGVTVSVLPFEDSFAEARREARREDLPKPLAVATTRTDGTFVVMLSAAAGTTVQLAFAGGAAATATARGAPRCWRRRRRRRAAAEGRGSRRPGRGRARRPGRRRERDALGRRRWAAPRVLAGPGCRPEGDDEGRRHVPLRRRRPRVEPAAGRGGRVRDRRAAAGPRRSARAPGAADAREGAARDGDARRPADPRERGARALRGADADDAVGGGARRRHVPARRGTARARDARGGRRGPRPGHGGPGGGVPPRPWRWRSPRPRRSAGAWSTPRAAGRSPASACGAQRRRRRVPRPLGRGRPLLDPWPLARPLPALGRGQPLRALVAQRERRCPARRRRSTCRSSAARRSRAGS